jgi:hypothetical protein
MTYGPVDPLVDAARYTDLATVRERLRIPSGNTTYDDRITTAIVSAEHAIDVELGRSFPDIGAVPGVAGNFLLAAHPLSGLIDGQLAHDGDTELQLSDGPLDGTAWGDPDGQSINLNYAYISQLGGSRVHLALTNPTTADDVWSFDTTVVSGAWAGFFDGTPVKASFFEGLAVPGVPVSVIEAATSVAMALYKNQDAPTGMAGSDAALGEIDVAELVRSAIARSPELRGFRTGAGFGVA